MSEIRTMQQEIISTAAQKQWQCIEAGIDQYLGRKVTEADAAFIEIRQSDDTLKVFYKDNLIGTLTGGWDPNFDKNLIKCTWTWTPEKII